MELNNNRDFYKKLFARIVFVFCLFFIVATNILRLQQLHAIPQKPQMPEPQKPSILYSVVFKSLILPKDAPRIVFIENNSNFSYLKKVFSFLKKYSYEQIFIADCTSSDASFLNSYFASSDKQTSLSEVSCDASLEEFSQILTSQNLLVFVFKDKNFNHRTILRAAQTLSLKPSIHLSEIEHED